MKTTPELFESVFVFRLRSASVHVFTTFTTDRGHQYRSDVYQKAVRSPSKLVATFGDSESVIHVLRKAAECLTPEQRALFNLRISQGLYAAFRKPKGKVRV